MRAYDLAASTVWAITEEALQTLLDIADRQNFLTPEALAAQLGRPLDNARRVTVRDGIATVEAIGPLFKYANLFSMVSGATSLEMLAQDFNAALADPTVKGILLHIDSPGGEANGVGELAGMIHQARDVKPVKAYVSGIGASGAYWLASAAGEIVMAPTALAGSIGVVSTYRDSTARDEKAGVRNLQFVSSQSPNKRPDLGTDKGRGQIQEMVDALASVFVADVARFRDVEEETVLSEFGAGGIKVGSAAVEAGMADRLGTYESVLAEMIGEAKAANLPRTPTRQGMAAQENETMNLWDQLKAALGGGEPAEPDATPQAPAPATLVPSVEVVKPADSEEVKALRAQVAQAHAARIAAEATAFARGEIAASRAYPAEEALMTALYVQAAQDDLQHPEATARTETLKALYAKRPAHGLTTEALGEMAQAGELIQVAPAQKTPGTDGKAGDRAPMSDERRRELLASSHLGKTVLNGKEG